MFKDVYYCAFLPHARSILNDSQYKGMNIKKQKPKSISKSKTNIKNKRHEEEETK